MPEVPEGGGQGLCACPGMCRRLCAEAHLSPGPAPSTACSSRPGITAPGRVLPGQIPSSPSLGLVRLGVPQSVGNSLITWPRIVGGVRAPCSQASLRAPGGPPKLGTLRRGRRGRLLPGVLSTPGGGFRASCSTLGSPLGWAPGQRGHSPSRKQFPCRGRPQELPSALPGGRRGWVTRARRPAWPSLPPSTLCAGGGGEGAGGTECQRQGLPSLASPGGDFGGCGWMGEERGP